ncbi:MAG: aminopeptidase P family protein [Clostridiales bacterium]|nr:aminopeptidase P family protein [Clostridiales bacterium]
MEIFFERVRELQSIMQAEGVEQLAVSPSANLRYLNGLDIMPDDRLTLAVFPAQGQPFLLVSRLYEGEAKALEPLFRPIFIADDASVSAALKQALSQDSGPTAIDERMWASHFMRLLEHLGRQSSYIPAGRLLSQLRVRKSRGEISLLKEAGRIAAAAFRAVLPQLRAGLTERQLVNMLELEMKKAGGEGLSFPSIAAFGANAANPHHSAGQAELAAGQFVMMDFGCTFQGYCSDITRTVCFGRADALQKELYQVVLQANLAARARVAPGVPAHSVERAAREIIEAAGYGPHFIHRIGHGVGLDVHEAPHFGEKSGHILREGMVFSIEPGLYLPGKIGLRIEDVVALDENGIEDMHVLDKELLEIV